MTMGAEMRGYHLEVYRDEDGSWVAEVPELPGCVAAAEDLNDLIEFAADAIDAWIDAALADGRDVPRPAATEEEYSGRFVLRISKGLHRRLALQARREGQSLNGYCSTVLAERSGAEEVQFAFLRLMNEYQRSMSHLVSLSSRQIVAQVETPFRTYGQFWPIEGADVVQPGVSQFLVAKYAESRG